MRKRKSCLISFAFAELNPNLSIPVLTDGDFTLYESMAISLCERSPHLSRVPLELTGCCLADLAKKTGGSIAPADLEEDALFMQWTLWAMTGWPSAWME